MSRDNGLKALKKSLKQFPINIQKNVVVGMTRAGCKPILEEARRLAPYEKGDLEKSIKITKRRSKKKHIVKFSVSAGNTVKTVEGKKRIFYAAFNEWGYTTKSGHAVMAHPFMRPALEHKFHESIVYAKEYARKRIPKEIAKLNR